MMAAVNGASGASEQPDGGSAGLSRRSLVRLVLEAPDSYGLLLFLLLIDYVILSVGWTGRWSLIVSTMFIGLTAVLTVHTSKVSGTVFKAVVVCSGVALVTSVAAAIADQDRARGVTFVIMAVLVVACPVAVVSRIVHHTRVTVETLLGAICVYVLIGLLFAYVDLAYQLIAGSSYFAQQGHHGPSDFVYFSFITMTTVGYGDLSPAHGLPRTMAVLEALAGQIFLVVMVSRLVALFTPMQRSVRLAMRQARARGMDPQEEAPADGDSAAVGPDAGRERTGPIAHMDDDDGLEP
jgi:Ion channel